MADDKVEISQKQLDELLEQNKQLMEQNNALAQANKADGKELAKPPKEITDRTVRIMFVNEKAVLGFVNHGTDARPNYVYEKPDPDNPKERILFVDVTLEGEKEAISVPYNDLLREGRREECRIVDTKEEPWRDVQGKTSQKVVDGYAMEETGVMVPIEVLGKTRVFTVQLPSGGTIEVHENYVNM